MEKRNIWETDFFDDTWIQTTSLRKIKQLLNRSTVIVLSNNDYCLKKNNLKQLFLSNFENEMKEKNITPIYTDEKHPFIYSKDLNIMFIESSFFENNKDEFLNIFYNNLIKEKVSYITIPNFLFSNEKLNKTIKKITSIKKIEMEINYNELDNEIIKLMQKKSIQCHTLDKKENNYFLANKNSKEETQCSDNLYFKQLEDYQLSHLKYIKPGTQISIVDNADISENIKLYIKLITNLENAKVNATVTIEENYISNKLLKNSGIPYHNYQFVTLNISRDAHTYSLKEYLEEDKKLDELVENIKNSDLSPFEQYLAAYNIVKQFKPYKECHDSYIDYLVKTGMDKESATEYAYDSKNQKEVDEWENNNPSNDSKKSRYLKYILDNDYIVCVGFATLFTDLLERLNIGAINIHLDSEESYNNGFTEENIPVYFTGHARTMVHIADPKYNIDGYYIADPTWDNYFKIDSYLHAAITLDETTKERHMQKLSNIDFVFNVHNMDEFNLKVNKLLDIKIREMENRDRAGEMQSVFDDDLLFDIKPDYKETTEKRNNYERKSLTIIISNIITLFKKIDFKAYNTFNKKYNEIRNHDIEKNNKQNYYDLLTDLGNYIVNKTNKTISGDQILLAAATVKLMYEDYTEEELNKYIENELREFHILGQSHKFPKREIYSSYHDEVTVINEENKYEHGKRK